MYRYLNQRFLLIFLFFIFISNVSLAFDQPYAPVHTDNFQQEYQSITKKYNHLLSQLSKRKKNKLIKQRKRKFLKKNRTYNYLNETQKQIVYQKDYLDKIRDFKSRLTKLYIQKANHSFSKEELEKEALKLALTTYDKVVSLKQQYKSFPVPILHNLFIDLSFKKRGACKHWAEDLLKHLRSIDRKFFTVTWGEANPKKMTEHNVAVIYPNTGEFKNGLIVDPWRTAGKPYWIEVKKDKKYKWQPWSYYGVF